MASTPVHQLHEQEQADRPAHLLTFLSHSFNFKMPVLVIVFGLERKTPTKIKIPHSYGVAALSIEMGENSQQSRRLIKDIIVERNYIEACSSLWLPHFSCLIHPLLGKTISRERSIIFLPSSLFLSSKQNFPSTYPNTLPLLPKKTYPKALQIYFLIIHCNIPYGSDNMNKECVRGKENKNVKVKEL